MSNYTGAAAMTTETFLAGLPAAPRFAQTYCSQCGRSFPAGNHGYSSCRSHGGRDAFESAYWSVEEMEDARRFANDAEDVARALVEGVREETAKAIATALQLLKSGRHDEAETVARRAEAGLVQEYLEA